MFAGERAALVFLRAQEPRRELLLRRERGHLIEAAFQLALETEGVTNGQYASTRPRPAAIPNVRTKDRRRRSEEAATVPRRG